MRAIGIVLAGGNNTRMKELSNKRAIAAMPVGGSYRAIDFTLSNMTLSHIQRVAVLTQYNARSLNEHLSSSKWWDFGRKQGGMYLFPPTVTGTNSWWYRGTADAMFQNLNWIRRSHEPYVVIASGDGIYKMDYNKVLEFHVAKRADVTVVCTECKNDDVKRFGVLTLNDDDRVVEYEEKPMVSKSNIVSCGVYIIRRRLLMEMLEKCNQEDRYDFVKDILIRYKDLKKICGYRFNGYWSNIASVQSYYRTNMDFLNQDVRRYFFSEEPRIMTAQADNPPVKFNPGSSFKNSIIGTGGIVNGSVENSVIFKRVYIGNNCRIKNSIILNDTYIGDNSVIENCIIESKNTLKPDSSYISKEGIRIVIEKNDRYEF